MKKKIRELFIKKRKGKIKNYLIRISFYPLKKKKKKGNIIDYLFNLIDISIVFKKKKRCYLIFFINIDDNRIIGQVPLESCELLTFEKQEKRSFVFTKLFFFKIFLEVILKRSFGSYFKAY